MKLPFFQMYPTDYIRDTRVLSLAARGGWVDVLCMLHGSSIRGTMTLPVVAWARVMSASVDQAETIIAELDGMKVADVQRQGNGDVTLSSRRMLREHISREQTRLRVARHRQAAASNGAETGHKSETRNQKPETKQSPKPPSVTAPAPDPRHHEITSRWNGAYQIAFEMRYMFAGKDAATLKRFLESNRDSADEILSVASQAWARSRADRFATKCKQAASIHGLCTFYNDIRVELKAPEFAFVSRDKTKAGWNQP